MAQLKNIKLLQKIALEVKALRGKVPQADVSDDTKINIGRIERGKHNISISTLDKLCKHFKIPMSEFLKRIEARK